MTVRTTRSESISEGMLTGIFLVVDEASRKEMLMRRRWIVDLVYCAVACFYKECECRLDGDVRISGRRCGRRDAVIGLDGMET